MVIDKIFKKIVNERNRQNIKWGFPQHNSLTMWGVILGEEVGEVMKEICDITNGSATDIENLKTELIQVASVCVNFLEHLEAKEVEEE